MKIRKSDMNKYSMIGNFAKKKYTNKFETNSHDNDTEFDERKAKILLKLITLHVEFNPRNERCEFICSNT